MPLLTGYLVMALIVSGAITGLAVVARRYFFGHMAPWARRYGRLAGWLAVLLDCLFMLLGPVLVWSAGQAMGMQVQTTFLLNLLAVNVFVAGATVAATRRFDRYVMMYFQRLASEDRWQQIMQEIRNDE